MIFNNNPQIKVGIGVLVFKEGKVLLCKRKGSHGAGEYGGPGGHLELGESMIDCAIRECREEVGIEIKNIKFLCVSNIYFRGRKTVTFPQLNRHSKDRKVIQRYSNQYIDISKA